LPQNGGWDFGFGVEDWRFEGGDKLPILTNYSSKRAETCGNLQLFAKKCKKSAGKVRLFARICRKMRRNDTSATLERHTDDIQATKWRPKRDTSATQAGHTQNTTGRLPGHRGQGRNEIKNQTLKSKITD
jgi:hypothetical protein